jgi:hypothetical protein
MGWSARAVAESSLWHFSRAFEGWKAANGAPEKVRAPTDEEFEAAVRASREAELGANRT